MATALFFALVGYLCGGVLFARLATDLFGKRAITQESKDGNPGAANAFRYGGFWCGALVLCGDLSKGILPVWLYLNCSKPSAPEPLLLAVVLAAPVVGHAFPLFYHFRGGKGIAVTFGSLLGLTPMWEPVVLFAAVFIFFSLVLRIDPHLYRTAATYILTLVLLALRCPIGVWGGFALMASTVLLRLHMSQEERPPMAVKLLWRS